jgi:ferritin-like metal-binding protein YciE
MDSLRELFVDQLQDVYDAEHQLIKVLPKMAKNASSNELRIAFENHLEQTKEQVDRLETIFRGIEEEPEGKSCKGMAGLIAEGKEIFEEDMDDDVKDAALIAAAQKVEHYEIAAYGTLKTFASLLDEEEAVSLLEQTLNEEKETDELLNEISEEVNSRAEGEQVMEEDRPSRRAPAGRQQSQRSAAGSRSQAKSSSRRKR